MAGRDAHPAQPVLDATKLAATVRDMFNRNPSLRPKLT